jgi:ferredoxin
MDKKVFKISQEALNTLAGRLLAQASVVAPVRTSAGEVDYDEITRPEQIAWDYSTSITSLKRFLFPQVEPLFEYSRNQAGLSLKPMLVRKPRVFLAVRPCDIAGVNFLDAVSSRDYDDPYYKARRQDTLLIGLACSQAAENCFCVCGDGGPFLEEGFDLQLVALQDGYLAEVGSQKGEALVRDNADLFTPAGEKEIEERARLAKIAEDSFGEPKSYFAAALRKLSFGKSEDEVWEKSGEVCLDCGGCAFICPTCTCFTVFDDLDTEGGERRRHWDACNYACYTREASGHNPRKEQSQRLKARFFHKLSYQFVLRNNRHACVGCGRCISVCLGEDSMPEVTARIRRGE